MPSCIFHIVVDRMIVSRDRLEGGRVCICKCAAWSPENVAYSKVLEPSWWHNCKTDRIEIARLLRRRQWPLRGLRQLSPLPT